MKNRTKEYIKIAQDTIDYLNAKQKNEIVDIQKYSNDNFVVASKVDDNSFFYKFINIFLDNFPNIIYVLFEQDSKVDMKKIEEKFHSRIILTHDSIFELLRKIDFFIPITGDTTSFIVRQAIINFKTCIPSPLYEDKTFFQQLLDTYKFENKYNNFAKDNWITFVYNNLEQTLPLEVVSEILSSKKIGIEKTIYHFNLLYNYPKYLKYQLKSWNDYVIKAKPIYKEKPQFIRILERINKE